MSYRGDAATITIGIGRGDTVPLAPQVFALRGQVYAVYLPTASRTGSLDLTSLQGVPLPRWFNPRTGEFVGDAVRVSGGDWYPLGAAPAEPNEDWVVLVERIAS